MQEKIIEIIEILSSKLGSYHIKNNQISFFCPKHSHHKRKLEINLEKGIFHCWVCEDYGGHILKLCYDLRMSETERKVFYDLYSKKDYESISQKSEIFTDDKYDLFFNENSYPFVREIKNYRIENQKNKSLQYLINKRQIERKDIIKFSIQFGMNDKYVNSIMFPSFTNTGKINGVITRYFYNPTMKYFQFRQQDSIWNELFIDWDEPLYITEGVFDYLKINDNGLCLAGSLINEQSQLFQKLAKHQNYKYFCLDKDAMLKSINIIKNLLKIGIEDIFILEWNNSNQNDLGEFQSKEESMEFIKNNLRPVTLSNVNVLELQYRIGV